MKIPLKKRYGFVSKTRRLVSELFCDTEEKAEALRIGGCVYQAITLQQVLIHAGYKEVMLQAGTINWPRMKPEEDDGEIGTHFSFEWQGPNERNEDLVMGGILPEMHVWLAHRRPDTIIDLSTNSFKERAELMGLSWTAPEPPPYLWHTLAQLRRLVKQEFPLGIEYTPSPEATLLADRASQTMQHMVYDRLRLRS